MGINYTWSHNISHHVCKANYLIVLVVAITLSNLNALRIVKKWCNFVFVQHMLHYRPYTSKYCTIIYTAPRPVFANYGHRITLVVHIKITQIIFKWFKSIILAILTVPFHWIATLFSYRQAEVFYTIVKLWYSCAKCRRCMKQYEY